MKVKIDSDDKRYFDSLGVDNKSEEDLILKLKSLGVDYNRDIDWHRQILKDMAGNAINIEQAIQLLSTRKSKEKNENSKGFSI